MIDCPKHGEQESFALIPRWGIYTCKVCHEESRARSEIFRKADAKLFKAITRLDKRYERALAKLIAEFDKETGIKL